MSRLAVLAILFVLCGCADRNQPAFTECQRVFLRETRLASDDLLMRSIDLCMGTKGYKRDLADATCGAPDTVRIACFRPDYPWLWLHAIFG
jgi:hypothetical protein